MALKRLMSKADYEKLPDVIKSEYKKSEVGDDYILDTDDSDYKKHLDEFRTNNRALHAQVEAAKAQVEKYKDIDPEKYRRAVVALDQLESQAEAELIKDGKLDEVISRRTAAMARDFESQLKATKTAAETAAAERDQYRSKLSGIQIEQTVLGEVERIGKLRPGARQDVTLRARTTWALNEHGDLIAKDEKGGRAYGTKGEPLTPTEWAQGLLKDASYLFEPAGGGGAKGNETVRTPEGARVIGGNDPVVFGRNAADILSGKVVVAPAGG